MKKLNLKVEDLNIENFQSEAMNEAELAGTHPMYCRTNYPGQCQESFEPPFCGGTNPNTDCRTQVQSICRPTNARTDCYTKVPSCNETKVSSCPTRSAASCPTRTCPPDTRTHFICNESRVQGGQPGRPGCP